MRHDGRRLSPDYLLQDGVAVRGDLPDGGPIGLLKDGDIIEIDIPNESIKVKLSAAELKKRAAAFKAPKPRYTKGYLAKYAKLATSADKGAILKWD